jgi:hypothetical protein
MAMSPGHDSLKVSELSRSSRRAAPGNAGSVQEVPVFAEAVNATLRTIEKRTGLYRNLIVGVCLLSIGCIVFAVIRRNWMWLLGGGLLVPLTGAYLWLDTRLVGQWQACILTLWLHRGLGLEIYKRTMSSDPRVPSKTLEGMLSVLPGPNDSLHRLSEPEKANPHQEN